MLTQSSKSMLYIPKQLNGLARHSGLHVLVAGKNSQMIVSSDNAVMMPEVLFAKLEYLK